MPMCLPTRAPDWDAPTGSPGPELIGHHASGEGAIEALVCAVPMGPAMRLVDLGSGTGKVAITAHRMTGVRAHGIEIQPALVARARATAAALGLDAVTFEQGDARTAPLEGDVFYLYLPFTGAALDAVMARLEALARRRPIVVAALGLDLRAHRWLRVRDASDFWLTVYDSAPSLLSS
jgi:precorrin-6B methylase 2